MASSDYETAYRSQNRPQRAEPEFHGISTQRKVGRGYHLHRYQRRLAVSGVDHGPVLTPDRWLGDGGSDRFKTCGKSLDDGDFEPTPKGSVITPL